MGRHAEGWKLLWRNGYGHVRFRHEGRRYFISTGSTDPTGAREQAARIYAEVVSGRRRKLGAPLRSKLELDMLFGEWLAALEGVLDEETVKTYRVTYVTRFIRTFRTFDAIDEHRIDEYARAGLRRALKRTVQKELGALRGFLRWCKMEGYLDAIPAFPEFPKTAKGKRSGKQRAKANELSEEQVILAVQALPLMSDRIAKADRRRFVVRPRFVVAYETGLRPATLNALVYGAHWRPGSMTLHLADEDDKSRFGRPVKLTPTAVEALEMTARLLGLKTGERIFGKHDYRVYLRAAGVAAGVPSLAAYDFRHAIATHMLDHGASLSGVAYQHGHTQTTTTAKYTHPTRRAGDAAIEVGRADLSGAIRDLEVER